MLIKLVALLHSLVEVYFGLAADDGHAADRASVVVISPAEQTLDMKQVINVALQRHDQVILLEID